jgi:hypothetical protein
VGLPRALRARKRAARWASPLVSTAVPIAATPTRKKVTSDVKPCNASGSRMPGFMASSTMTSSAVTPSGTASVIHRMVPAMVTASAAWLAASRPATGGARRAAT